MVYADFVYYATEYYGSAIPETGFIRIIKKASQYIDHFTFDRIKEKEIGNYPTLPDCACAMADALYMATGDDGIKREKKSENIDGYSVSYVTENSDGKNAENVLRSKLYSIAQLYLSETGLLYCGVE